jgi:hypothetical protein
MVSLGCTQDVSCTTVGSNLHVVCDADRNGMPKQMPQRMRELQLCENIWSRTIPITERERERKIEREIEREIEKEREREREKERKRERERERERKRKREKEKERKRERESEIL